LSRIDKKHNHPPDTLHNYPDTIDQRIVAAFVEKIPSIYSKQVSIEDLAFSQEEYDSCKRYISDIKSMLESGKKKSDCPFIYDMEDPDFDRLTTFVDRVKTINPQLLNWYFLGRKDLSTARFWTKVTLVNKNGDELNFANDGYEYNPLYFPWHVKLNASYSGINTAVEISTFITQVYPEFLRGNRARSRLLQELVKYLYYKYE